MTYDLLWDQDQGIQLGARTMLVQGPGPTLTGTTPVFKKSVTKSHQRQCTTLTPHRAVAVRSVVMRGYCVVVIN